MNTAVSQLTNQNAILYVLCASEFIERSIYFGTLTFLVLYFNKIFHYSDSESYQLFGIYTFLSFALPVAGGFIADRLFGLTNSLIFGLFFLFLGNTLLVFPINTTTYLGLAFTMVGIAFYKPAITSMVATNYQNKSELSEKAFTIFYVAINAGATIGPLIYGLYIRANHWQAGFINSVVGIALASMILLLNFKRLSMLSAIKKENQIQKLKHSIIIILISVFAAIILALLFCYQQYFQVFFICYIVAIISLLIWVKSKSTLSEYKKLHAILILCLFCLFFFSASLQVGSSITLFIDRNVDRHLFGWVIPTPFFSALDPLFVVIMAPILSVIWKYLKNRNIILTATDKLMIGLWIASISFICFSIATCITSFHLLSLIIITLAFLLIGAGEVCLMPAMLSIIGQYAPIRLKATTMGLLYLVMACGGNLSSFLAQINFPMTNNSFTNTFIFTSIVTVMMGLVLLGIRGIILKRLHE